MKKIGLILLIGSLIGCVSDQLDSSEKTTLQGIVKTTRVVNLEDCDLFQAKGLVKSGKTIISISPTNDYNAVSIDLESTQMRRFFQRRFSGNDNMFQVSSLNSCDGRSVTALDFRKGRVIETEILPSTRSAGGNSETIIQLPPDQQHLAAVKTSSFILGTGLYAEGRYLIYSLADHTARYSLSYPDHPEYSGLQETTKGMLYASSVLRVRPDESAFVCADMYSGVIDFCRIHIDTIKRIKLVRLHYPKVEISETPYPRVTYYKDNHFGFMDVAVTQDRVYALYSGKTYQEARNKFSECNTLLVYDWEGNLVRSCLLDISLINITYDQIDNTLYGMTAELKITKVPFQTEDR